MVRRGLDVRGEGEGVRGKKIASRESQERGRGGGLQEQRLGIWTCSSRLLLLLLLLLLLMLLLLTKITTTRSCRDDAAGSARVGIAPV